MTGLLGRLLNTWRSWSVRRRAITAGVLAIAAVGLGVLAYEVLKRPADVTNENVDFVESKKQKAPKPERPEDTTVDWPTYGFNDARTRYFPTKLVRPPFRPSDWSSHFGKLLEFSPIIVDDRIYVMDIETRFLALDAKNGKTIWEKRVGKLNATSPAYSDGRLFATNLEPGQALALRARDGKLIWKTPLPGRSESSPLAFQDKLVIFGCECGTVFALDQKDGSIEWTVDTSGEIKGALAQGSGNVYGGNYAGEAFAIDAETGKRRVARQHDRRQLRPRRRDLLDARGCLRPGLLRVDRLPRLQPRPGQRRHRLVAVDRGRGLRRPCRRRHARTRRPPSTSARPTTTSMRWTPRPVRSAGSRTRAAQVTGAGSVIGDVAYFSVIGDAIGSLGYNVKTGEKVFEHELGEYNPAITDGERLYLTGYSTVRAFRPEPPGGKKGGKKQQGKKSEKRDGKKRKRSNPGN